MFKCLLFYVLCVGVKFSHVPTLETNVHLLWCKRFHIFCVNHFATFPHKIRGKVGFEPT